MTDPWRLDPRENFIVPIRLNLFHSNRSESARASASDKTSEGDAGYRLGSNKTRAKVYFADRFSRYNKRVIAYFGMLSKRASARRSKGTKHHGIYRAREL